MDEECPLHFRRPASNLQWKKMNALTHFKAPFSILIFSSLCSLLARVFLFRVCIGYCLDRESVVGALQYRRVVWARRSSRWGCVGLGLKLGEDVQVEVEVKVFVSSTFVYHLPPFDSKPGACTHESVFNSSLVVSHCVKDLIVGWCQKTHSTYRC